MAKLCILGGGFIGRFYAESLIGRRGKSFYLKTIDSPLK
jgi:hypothetical protein